MLGSDHITVLTTFLVAIAMMALAAVAHERQLPVRNTGDYLPPVHCLENPKIDGCSDPSVDEIKPHSNGANPSFAVALFIACSSLLVVWRVANISDAKEREKIITGILIAMILFAGRYLIV